MQDPVLRRFATADGKFVQVLQVDKSHWICVAGNKNNQVSLYDSMGDNLSQDAVHVIAKMFKCEYEELMVHLIPVQHQTKGNDCGLFALAFSTDFAEGIDLSERYYDELQIPLVFRLTSQGFNRYRTFSSFLFLF